MKEEIKSHYEFALGFAVVSRNNISVKVICGENFNKNLEAAKKMVSKKNKDENYYTQELIKTVERLHDTARNNKEKIAMWKALSNLRNRAIEVLQIPKENWRKNDN
jgi:hypothetical protein